MVSVWSYPAFLMEVFEVVGLYLQLGYSVLGNYSLPQIPVPVQKGPSANFFGWFGVSW